MSARTRGVAALALGLATVSLAAGCGQSAVTVNAPISDPAAARACAELVAALPDTLADLERREVAPGDAPAAAWGDPPIVLTCGGTIPQEYDFAPCVETVGIGWYLPEDAGPEASYRISTVGQDPTVVVEMPTWPPATVMVDLAPLVAEHTEQVSVCW